MTIFRNLDEFMSQNGYVMRGNWYPRVTSILQIKAKPALYKFYGDAQSFNHALSMSGRAASLGTRVHNAVEAILAGRPPELSPDIMPSIQAFQDFRKAHSINARPDFIEQLVYHPVYKYAGTVDVFAEVDGIFGILDIKTSSGMWRDYNLQTAAYFAAAQEENFLANLPTKIMDKKPQTRWILRIDQARVCRICGANLREKGGRDKVSGGFDFCEHDWGPVRGEWELKDLNADGLEPDFKAFLAAKALWEWENEYWLKQIN